MDDTLCDTQSANKKAVEWLLNELRSHGDFDHETFITQYLAAIYRELDEDLKTLTNHIEDESDYRHYVFDYFLRRYGVEPHDELMSLVRLFDAKRIEFYNFYPGAKEMLCELRRQYKIILITNGPEYSQIPKVKQVKMADFCDHVIIGGQEPEQKPAKSIFDKALSLAGCKSSEAIHAGDSLNSDICGARNAGLKSLWIRPEFEFSDKNEESDYQSSTVLDMVRVLELEE